MKVPNIKGVWYEHYITECAICGTGDHYRERRLPPAPPVEDRYHFKQFACDTHFY